MRHAPLAHTAPHPATRGLRRWRRMRARIGLMALWAALLVWALGASVHVPGEGGLPRVAAAARSAAPVSLADPALPGPEQADLELAAAWPRESADAWQAPSQEAPHEPTPEEEAALYIAGR